jgi:hypothetical protein
VIRAAFSRFLSTPRLVLQQKNALPPLLTIIKQGKAKRFCLALKRKLNAFFYRKPCQLTFLNRVNNGRNARTVFRVVSGFDHSFLIEVVDELTLIKWDQVGVFFILAEEIGFDEIGEGLERAFVTRE